ncbi:MAG: BREX system ATP-binding domain-containing protein [Candidatus Xenobia bacterium]
MLALQEYLSLARTEYLEGYIRDGGSAVKFAVCPTDETAETILGETQRMAESSGYLVTRVNAAQVKVHLMHQLFHEVARQTPWDALTRQVVRNCYLEMVPIVPEDDLSVDAVAEANAVPSRILKVDIRRSMENLLNRSHELSKDFRYAMLSLCLAEVAPEVRSRRGATSILQWLIGDLRLISALRDDFIYRKIDRHNGRAMLSSLGAWARMAGRTGLLLQLDMRQLLYNRRADVPAGTHFYTAPALMDAYEVLRQVVDATDDLSGIFCLVIFPPNVYDDDKRGVKVYRALHERVSPEVRVKSRPNPLSALATISNNVAPHPGSDLATITREVPA